MQAGSQSPPPSGAASPKVTASSLLSLFTSLGTLVCCALPSLLVLAGLGATVASTLSAVPWLVALSRHKAWTFGVAGVLIAGNMAYVYWLAPRLRARALGCRPGDPAACQVASRFSRRVLWLSAALYGIGLFAAYLLGPLLARFAS
jgi:mercuric ion transport protein